MLIEGSQDHPVWPINFSSVPPPHQLLLPHTTHTPTQTGQPHPPSSYELCFPAYLLFSLLGIPLPAKWSLSRPSFSMKTARHSNPLLLCFHCITQPFHDIPVTISTLTSEAIILICLPQTPCTVTHTLTEAGERLTKLAIGLSKSHKGIILSKITIVSKQEPSLWTWNF